MPADDVITEELASLGLDMGEEPPPFDYPEADNSIAIAQPNALEGIVALGHDRGRFYYLSMSAKQVVELTAGGHSPNTLKGMASAAHFWERTVHKDGKGGVKWDQAIDWLMGECRRVGIYNPDMIRGRGAWIDNGRNVLHVGDQLIVDGEVKPLTLEGSPYVYELAQHLTETNADPVSSREANKLVAICESLRWDKPVSGVLLAGFLVVAPICGGLAWRPNAYITGGSGSGKSFVKDSIVNAVLGRMALQVIGNSTEPGIRRALGSDARPVVFEEAEAEDRGAAMRFQAVLGLMRQSSSEGGGDIYKAAGDGGVDKYHIRSSFLFFGINPPVHHQADANRITFLTLRNGDTTGGDGEAAAAAEAAFEKLKRMVADTLTPTFAAGLLARSVRLLPLIRANAETFARAISIRFGSRRLGDQLGALLAGAYSLHSDKRITDAAAEVYVGKHQWEDTVEAEAKDEVRLLSHITQHRLRFGSGNGPAVEIAIGGLCLASFGRNPDAMINADTAHGQLLEHGIKPAWEGQTPGVYVSTNHPALKRLMAGTQWSANWCKSLARLPGAEVTGTKRFATGHTSKACWIPWSTIDPESPDDRAAT